MKKIKEHSTIFFAILLFFSVLGEFLMIFIGMQNRGGADMVQIGRGFIPLNSLQGTIQTFTFMLCILMSCIECYIGPRISYFLVGFMIMSTSMRMIMGKTMAPLPGVLNGLLTVVAIALIGHLLRSAKKKSITDYATGKLNTVGFLEILNKKIKDKKSGSLVYYQVNNFRSINDDYGHDIGDRVLRIVSERMAGMVGKDGIVGRIGGSEFAILLNDKIDATELVSRMLKVLNEKMVFDKEGIHLDCYIEGNAGIAHFPKDAKDSNILFKCADVALMTSLKNGSNTIAVFDEKMLSKMNSDKEVEQLIKRAYDEKYFYLEYQPQYSVSDKRLRGFESLIRMKLPDGRRISPAEFIPVAEKSNLIFSIDEYVLDFVTKEFSKVVEEAKEKVTISVNISANGISRPEFVSIVENCLKKNNFKAENLEVEITEYSFDDSQEQTIKNINKLKEMGVQVALDDFGTGYASLGRLMNLSVDLLKIDKSLVDNIEKGEVNRDFINSIGSLGHLIDCKVILEGVETDSQVEYIKKLDCDYIQGYVWGKPMSFENAAELIV